MVAAEAMFVARMRGSWPDTIDKAELLHLLQAQKSGCTDQFFFTEANRNQIIEAIAHGTDRLLIG